ncbi:MAG: hypothetical protein J0L93_11270 [Deltaproteobacteria bacterium]|nr:hypothetical protein [Deltaproteobacteria bacterium]
MSLKLLFTLGLYVVQADAHFEQTSSSLTAKALELIQKNEKSKALKLLEQAFDKTQDPVELREISALILEASPLNYSKRDSYLKYLIKYFSDSDEAWSWYKELGDRAFEAGKASEAEDWYLRSLPLAKDRNLVRYKLAWVQWNLKNRVSALTGFLEVILSIEPSLQAQLVKEIPRLWWEIGPIPADQFEKIAALPDNLLSPLMNNLLEKSQLNREPTPSDSALLTQVRDDGRTKIYFLKAIHLNTLFPKTPCFLFYSLLTPDDSYSPENLLACMKSSKKPSASLLLSFLERYSGEPNEKLEWARAELLVDQKRISEACIKSLQITDLAKRSKAFLHYISQLVMQLSQKELRDISQITGNEPFEILMKTVPNPFLLERLQAIDPQVWITYEENSFNGRTPTKNFFLKKGGWISQRTDLMADERVAQLAEIFQKLLVNPAKGPETNLKKDYEKLKNLSETTLPSTFSSTFKKEYDAWLSSMDSCIGGLSQAPSEWQAIARPVFHEEIKKNALSLISQIDATTLDPELASLGKSFEQKKEELKAELQKKYLDKK